MGDPTKPPTATDKAKGYGTKAWNWSYKVSDKLAVYANAASHKVGAESFWPAAGDTPQEIEKCIRILKAFTETGVATTESKEVTDEATGKKVKKSRKVINKIPSAVLRQAKGLAIYTAMRSGIAPLSGAGGCGMVMARLPDGSWSPPTSILPNNVSGGLMFGMDIYDVVLIIRTEKAMESFHSHKVSVGAELGLAAGPYGAGAIVESGKEMTPCWSYVKSRGFYAGVEAAAALLISRYDEMARFYHRPGVTAKDILTGKVHMPYEARPLLEALRHAEQLPFSDPTPETPFLDDLELDEGETLHLPPTPTQMAMDEGVDFKQAWHAQDRAVQDEEDERIYRRAEPPPLHHARKTHLSAGAQKSVPPKPGSGSGSGSAQGSGPGTPMFEDDPRIETPPLASGSTAPMEAPPPIPPRRRPVPPPPQPRPEPASQEMSKEEEARSERKEDGAEEALPVYEQEESLR